MIISHKHKFIFIKPRKVAGTSIELALSKFCDKEDIITGNFHDSNYEDEAFTNKGRNYEELNLSTHSKPNEIKNKISKDIWNNYYKFTIVRNPWDQVVSSYFWYKYLPKPFQKNITIYKIKKNLFNKKAYYIAINKIKVLVYNTIFKNRSDFIKFIFLYLKQYINTAYYFDKKGNNICDFYIKYENLEEDYRKVCSKLNLPYEKLPKTKNKLRKGKKHYSDYFNKKTENKVRKLFKKEILFFNYSFEDKNLSIENTNK